VIYGSESGPGFLVLWPLLKRPPTSGFQPWVSVTLEAGRGATSSIRLHLLTLWFWPFKQALVPLKAPLAGSFSFFSASPFQLNYPPLGRLTGVQDSSLPRPFWHWRFFFKLEDLPRVSRSFHVLSGQYPVLSLAPLSLNWFAAFFLRCPVFRRRFL